MIEITSGDILAAEAEALVNTVNCVGVMGRGIALQFKRAYPANFTEYAAACENGEVEPGRMFVHETGRLTNPKFIVNFPTKRHWRAKSRLEDIETGLVALVQDVHRLGIESIAIPPLGCGLGGLSWPDVLTRIEEAFHGVTDVKVIVYAPLGAPEADEMVRVGKVPNWTPGRAVLVALMDRYMGGLMDPDVSLLEVHKLMYFAQMAGVPLQLDFTKGHYGPYAENLRHVLNHIEGHFITGFADGGEQPWKPLRLRPGARGNATKMVAESPEISVRFERVADLVDGFETPNGMELLATVHWVARSEGASTPEDAVQQIHAWNERKKRFTQRQIEIAWTVLHEKGWLDTQAVD